MSKNKKEKKNNIEIYPIPLILFVVFFLLLIVYNNTGDRLLLKKDKKVALEYIYKKYKIKPQILNSEIDTGCSDAGFIGCNKTEIYGTIFNMNYKNKEFRVYVPIDDSPKDDYQLEDIKEGYAKYISKIVGVMPYEYDIDFIDRINEGDTNNTFKEYYDGNNIEKVVDYYEIECFFKYIGNADLLKIEQSKSFLNNENMYGKFIQFNSLYDYNESIKYKDNLLSDGESELDPLYLKDMIIIGDNHEPVYHYYGDIKKLDIPYVVEKDFVADTIYDTPKELNKYISKDSNKNNIEFDTRYTSISPVYTIDYATQTNKSVFYDYERVYVYLTKKDINGFNEKELSNYKIANISYRINGEKKIVYEKVSEIGNYIRVNLDCTKYCSKQQIVMIK